MNNFNLGGIVLCGGKSSRIGKDKGMLLYNNKCLVLHAIDIINPYCTEVILSTNNPEYAKFGYSII